MLTSQLPVNHPVALWIIRVSPNFTKIFNLPEIRSLLLGIYYDLPTEPFGVKSYEVTIIHAESSLPRYDGVSFSHLALIDLKETRARHTTYRHPLPES